MHDLVDDVRINGAEMKFQLRGYGVKVFNASGVPVSAEASVSEDGVEYVKEQLAFLDGVERMSKTDFELQRLSLSRDAVGGEIEKAKAMFRSGDCVAAMNVLNHPDLIDLRNYCREHGKVKEAPQSVYRVDCGSSEKYTDSSGNTWLLDQPSCQGTRNYGYTDPPGATVDREASGRKFSFPDYRIYTTERYGLKGYLFRVPNGKYTVRLHTMEGFKPDNGLYDPAVLINGKQEIKPYYIFAEVGFDKPLIKEVKGIDVGDGLIRLEFESMGARVCGIEVIGEK